VESDKPEGMSWYTWGRLKTNDMLVIQFVLSKSTWGYNEKLGAIEDREWQ